MRSDCCGHPIRRRRSSPVSSLSPNPKVASGIKMFYLGLGARSFRGTESGLTYYVGDHRRDFLAHKEDVKKLLRFSDIILAP